MKSKPIPAIQANSINESTVIIGSNNTVAVALTTRPPGRIDLDVSVPKNDDPEVSRLLGDTIGGFGFGYVGHKRKETLTIKPDVPYWGEYQSGSVEAIDTAYYEAPELPANFPILDIRFLNNSDKSVVIKEILLDVAQSRPDDDPFIILISAKNECGAVVVENAGWSSVKNCVFEFNLYPANKSYSSPNKNVPYKYRLETGSFKDVTRLDFRQPLRAEGIDIDFLQKAVKRSSIVTDDLPRFKKALGRFSTGFDLDDPRKILSINKPDEIGDSVLSAVAEGQLKVFSDTSPETPVKTIFFEAIVPLTRPGGLGGALAAVGGFEVKLKTSGNAYPVRIPVSAQLKPGDAERFLVRLAARQSSWHRFVVKGIFMNDQTVVGPSVDLSLFLPRNNFPSRADVREQTNAKLKRAYTKLRRREPK